MYTERSVGDEFLFRTGTSSRFWRGILLPIISMCAYVVATLSVSAFLVRGYGSHHLVSSLCLVSMTLMDQLSASFPLFASAPLSVSVCLFQ